MLHHHRIELQALGDRFALIPQHALDGVRLDRLDHGIPEDVRIVLVGEWITAPAAACSSTPTRLGSRCACRRSGLSAAAAAADLNAATLRRKAIHDRLETCIGIQHILAHPCRRTTRAKRRRDEPDGLVDGLCKSREKQVPDGRKARHRLRRADLPLATTSSSGSSLILSGTLNSLIFGQLAAAISSASLAMPANRCAMPGYLAVSPETTKSIFDWPDPSHTSR